ncbi:MAG: 30S ribosomal protein S17 [Chloroflexi bacterium]|nr:MAG: 30S ribosomal protein S17 [Chloroflexota bacterium]
MSDTATQTAPTAARGRRKVRHDIARIMTVGDLVRITETRPISKEKRWRVLEIVEKAR